ncbi:anti-sigma factor [Pseudomonas gingeri NCPPB 3146 = LMG 5327]|uniref:Regulator of SigK n=3 Tax=Pseudomonas gingeri TaxID=117681 RepID=A0A7Y7XZC0_9PSED|nr:anti-sigma factor [Pseudomonas gingeri]NVZ62246.1 anti-sigma factor [Pseudomonas gingeri]NWC14691.1 anti-sigma factor [Pseudomonas gingeri]NWE44393.1 anti-sigma factor [Pseudomonas gingeri]NWE67210.1 anti-sigma factor [Pseudomonas gingeri]PNQ94183.1 anti-sigma factor [Pseudomonas gingeri NCPPB 3146 = LMG 5327]
MNYQNPRLRRALAADYAIGLMSAAGRRRFESLMRDDARLRAQVAEWQETLATLTESVPPQPVPDRVWQAIVARIDPQQLHIPARRPFWNWLRATAAICSLVVIVALGVLYRHDPISASATLLSGTQQPALRIEAHAGYLQVEPLTLAAVDANRSLELWAIPLDGKPVSLGLVPREGKGRLELSEAHKTLLGTSVVLAVSLEPQGGSPTGQPSGPVLYSGPLAAL